MCRNNELSVKSFSSTLMNCYSLFFQWHYMEMNLSALNLNLQNTIPDWERNVACMALPCYQILITVIKLEIGITGLLGYFRTDYISILQTRSLVVNRERGLPVRVFRVPTGQLERTEVCKSVVQVSLLQPFPHWIKHDAVRLLGSVSRWTTGIQNLVINSDVRRGTCYCCRGFRYENRRNMTYSKVRRWVWCHHQWPMTNSPFPPCRLWPLLVLTMALFV